MAGGGGGGGYYPTGGGGSGGGGGGGGGGGADDPVRDRCALRFEATISGPNSDYSDQLTMGAVLAVRLGGAQGRTFELVTSEGYVVGSLIGFPQAGVLLECMGDGHSYQATVVSRASGTIGVLVERVSVP